MSSRFSRKPRRRSVLRRRLGNFNRLTLIRLAAATALFSLLVVVAIGFFIGRPISNAIKGWHARRLSDQAMALMDNRQWEEAAKRTRDALVMRPSEPAAWEAAARLLSKTGQGSAALGWWKAISQSRPLNLSEQRDYASAALSASELSLAEKQIDLLRSRKPGPNPADLCLAAQLATSRGDSQAAVRDAEQIIEDKRTTSGELFVALALVFLNATPDSPSYLAGLDHLVALARTDNGAMGLEALRLLAKSPPRPRLTEPGNTPLTVVLPKNLISKEELADRLQHHEGAQPADHLLALQLRAQAQPERAEEFIARGVEAFRKGDDDSIAVLSAWLYENGRFQTMLEILTPPRVATKRDLLMERIDALAALGRYADLAAVLQADNAALDDISRNLFMAVTSAKLGETTASKNAWERALQLATGTEQFRRIAQFAEAQDAPETADAAYQQILVLEPKSRVDYLARLRLAEAMGRTANARKITAEIVKLWPDDIPTRMHDWYLQLLLNSSPEQTATIAKDVEDLATRKSLGSDASATLALARLRSGTPSAALSAFTFKGVPVALATTSAMAIHATVLAENGWKDLARNEARKLITAKLLPEERAMLEASLNAEHEATNSPAATP